ncbi:MAG: flippase-like domain-containing protein [Phycisphaerae bacterium]|nr:flippase-like domain-containing protein [Phycisphaerae bacterium]
MPTEPVIESADVASEPARSSPWRRWLFRILKYALLAVVLVALGSHVRKLIADWRAHESVLRDTPIRPGWLIVAALTYGVGQVCFAAFWWRLLVRLGLHRRFSPVLQAYGIGTMGKYVPGKALVVLIRTGMITIPNVGRVWVGLSAVYETFVMMSVGGLLAAVCLFIVRSDDVLVWAGAAAAGIGLSAVLHPVFFGRFARLIALPFRREGNELSTAGWYTAYWKLGWISAIAWVLSGASLFAVLLSLGVERLLGVDFLLAVGTAALATTAGFIVVVLPAGVGVRELIIIHLLEQPFGHGRAVLASLILRTVWTLTEIALAGGLYGLYLWHKPRRPSENREATSDPASPREVPPFPAGGSDR